MEYCYKRAADGGQSEAPLLQKRLAATLQRPRKPVAHIEALFWQFMGRDVYIIERAKEEPGAN